MPSRRRLQFALPPAALVLLALAGCGGDDEPARSETATATVTKTVTAPAPRTTGTTTAPSPAPDPSASMTLREAEALLGEKGYATLTARDWRPDQPLKVLLGIERSRADPRALLAFFFVGETFIGTDTKDPSGSIAVVEQTGDAVTLRYGLYRPGDSVDAPTGGSADVTYAWDGERLTPQDPIPTADPDAPLSRR